MRLRRSDLVFANCEPLREQMSQYAPDIELLPNAFEMPPAVAPNGDVPAELAGLGGPIVGYVGNLSSRLDLDLIDRVATARPGWQIVLIGSAHLSRDVVALDRHDNVHLLGVRPYEEAKRYIRHFDVAIVPHRRDPMTDSMNPLKPYVYLAEGVPVVSTDVGGLGDLREVIAVARDDADFIAQIDAAIGRDPGAMREAVGKMIRANTWPTRVERIVELVDAAWESEPAGALARHG